MDGTIKALKALALKVCSTATTTDLDKLTRVDEILNYIATKYDGGKAA